MFHPLTKSISATALLLVTSSPYAAVMTFINTATNPSESSWYTPYQEDGITTTHSDGEIVTSGGSPNALHLDDFSGPGLSKCTIFYG
jgi:hypothetical protein